MYSFTTRGLGETGRLKTRCRLSGRARVEGNVAVSPMHRRPLACMHARSEGTLGQCRVVLGPVLHVRTDSKPRRYDACLLHGWEPRRSRK